MSPNKPMKRGWAQEQFVSDHERVKERFQRVKLVILWFMRELKSGFIIVVHANMVHERVKCDCGVKCYMNHVIQQFHR